MDQPNEDALRLMVEAALNVKMERAQLLGQVKDALSLGDRDRAIALMKRYCGMKQ